VKTNCPSAGKINETLVIIVAKDFSLLSTISWKKVKSYTSTAVNVRS